MSEIHSRLIADLLREKYKIQIGQPVMPTKDDLNTSGTDCAGVENRKKFDEVVKGLEDEIILYVIADLVSRKVISPTVYENAVNILLRR